jgi:hypothetical protein
MLEKDFMMLRKIFIVFSLSVDNIHPVSKAIISFVKSKEHIAKSIVIKTRIVTMALRLTLFAHLFGMEFAGINKQV